MVSSVCQASSQTVKYHTAYSPCFGHSVLYTISKIKGLLYCYIHTELIIIMFKRIAKYLESIKNILYFTFYLLLEFYDLRKIYYHCVAVIN